MTRPLAPNAAPSTTAQPMIPEEQLVPLLPLNAGGQPIDLPQAAVDAFPESDLARWAYGAVSSPRDEAGRIFINRNPGGVAALTDYLRGGQELNTLSADRLAALAAESKALHMGAALDNTIEWERLRRRVGDLPLQALIQRDGGNERASEDTVKAWLRFADLSAARGEPWDVLVDENGDQQPLEAPMFFGRCYSDWQHSHYTPLLEADPNHRRALLSLSHCSAISKSERLAHARHLYCLESADPISQLNLVVAFGRCGVGSVLCAEGRDREPAAASVARLLRALAADDAQETAERLALAERLEAGPLAALRAEFARPENSEAALAAGILLNRLRRQHKALSSEASTSTAEHQRLADEREQLELALGDLMMYALPLLAEQVLQLPDAAKDTAPALWWGLRLQHRSWLVTQRLRLQGAGDHPPHRDEDADFLQAGYEELWAVYAKRQSSADLAWLAQALARDAERAEPEVQTMLTAQKARLRAAAALHGPEDRGAAFALQCVNKASLPTGMAAKPAPASVPRQAPSGRADG